MTLSESLIAVLHENSRDEEAFQRLMNALNPLLDEQSQQARLAAVIHSSTHAFIAKNLDGIITDWNPAAEQMYGYTAAEAIGQPISIIIPPDHLQELALLMESVRHGEMVEHYETVRQRKDGSTLHIVLTLAPIRTADGSIIGISVISHDITEIKQIQAALKASEARLRSIIETIDEGVWAVEAPSRRLIYASPALYRIFGISGMDDFLNHETRIKMAHPDDRAYVDSSLGSLLSTGSMDIQYRIVRPDGAIRWVHHRAWLIYNQQGQLIRGEGIISDITGRKLTQQRTVELEIERERVKLLHDFITHTSHELRNPLAIIAASTETMLLLDNKEKRQAKYSRIMQQIRRLTKMIEQLQEMAKLDQLTCLETVPLYLDELAQSVMAQYTSDRTNVTLTAEFASGLSPVNGNPYYVDIAITQLLDNAVHFSFDGGQVLLRTCQTDNEAIIEVKDHGEGIAAEHQERIFDHFYKGDSARSLTTAGIGMGLTFVKRIMELHQGYVTVDSVVRQGTTICLHFPIGLPNNS